LARCRRPSLECSLSRSQLSNNGKENHLKIGKLEEMPISQKTPGDAGESEELRTTGEWRKGSEGNRLNDGKKFS